MNKNGYFQSDKDGNVTKAPPKKQPPPFSGSWNDLTDKPFGESVEALVPETSIEIPEGSDDLYVEGAISIDLVIGNTYKVVWDGVEYECVCWDADGSPAIGNGEFWDYSNGNNEPFLVSNYEGITAVNVGKVGQYTITIIGNAIKQIDPKYLPSGVTTFYRFDDEYIYTLPEQEKANRATKSDVDEALACGTIRLNIGEGWRIVENVLIEDVGDYYAIRYVTVTGGNVVYPGFYTSEYIPQEM